MTDIELRNENGKIVGYDSDGNKVPVSFEDGSFDSLDTDEASLNFSNGFSYVIYKDGSDVVAVDGSDKTESQRSADAHTVIQYALDQIGDEGRGGQILIRAGDYTVAGTLQIGNGTTLAAESYSHNFGSTKLKLADGSDQNLILFDQWNGSDIVGATIKGLILDGNKSNNSSGHVIKKTSGAKSVHIHRVVAERAPQDNLNADNAYDSYVHNSEFKFADGYGVNATGLDIGGKCILSDNVTGGGNLIDGTIENSQVNNNGDYGLKTNFVTVDGCYIAQNENHGIYNPIQTTITGNRFTGNNPTSYQGDIAILRSGNVVEDNQINAATEYGIYLHSGSQVVDNIVDSNNIFNHNTAEVQVQDWNTNLVNGIGHNSGDPSTTGDWNGNGREGVTVYDTSVGRPYTEYQYVDGAWQTA